MMFFADFLPDGSAALIGGAALWAVVIGGIGVAVFKRDHWGLRVLSVSVVVAGMFLGAVAFAAYQRATGTCAGHDLVCLTELMDQARGG